jgi:hypothetical protein
MPPTSRHMSKFRHLRDVIKEKLVKGPAAQLLSATRCNGHAWPWACATVHVHGMRANVNCKARGLRHTTFQSSM